MMKEKQKTNLGTYDCSDFGDGYGIFPSVYGSDYCI